MKIEDTVRSIPDFPKEGIIFRDITTMLKNKEAFSEAISRIVKAFENKQVDIVVGPEARGFIAAAPCAVALGAGFVPARKPGKLPCECETIEYELEYGTDKLQIHTDAIYKGAKVAVIDDLLATGGTAKGVCELVEKMGGEVVGLGFMIELPALKGRETLSGYDVYSVMAFDGE